MTRSICARQRSFIRQQRNVIVVHQNRPSFCEGSSQKRALKCLHIILDQPPTMSGEFVIRGIQNK